MIVLTIVRSSSKMSIVAPVVSEIFEKTGAYVITMFWKNYFLFSKFDKISNRNNKQTFRCYGNTESGPLFCTDKFFLARLGIIGLVCPSVCPSVSTITFERIIRFRPKIEV